MQMQAQVSQNLGEDESVLADLVSKSQSAEGALQATQAMNQLLALQAKQSIQSQRLQITQDRATALELARQAAATERAREVRRRFLGDGTPYTPRSEEHTSELQSLMRNSYAVLCLKKKKHKSHTT